MDVQFSDLSGQETIVYWKGANKLSDDSRPTVAGKTFVEQLSFGSQDKPNGLKESHGLTAHDRCRRPRTF